MIGESPILPRILKPAPLVVQLSLKFPNESIATIPIVSWFHSPLSNLVGANGPCPCLFSILIAGGLYSDFFNQLSYAFCASGESFCSSNGNPSATANCCAPVPTSITCGVFSITLLATEMGCFILSKKATLPQLNLSSIMLASSVTNPSRSGLAPRPTQQFCEFSVTITPFSTASIAFPFLLKTSQAALLAASPASQVEITTGFPATICCGGAAITFFPTKAAKEVKAEACI